jgi:3-phosphoshikimate 1-carboxyvinyltransferase
VEADWSGASYWYEMAVMAEDVDVELIGLTTESLQGDAQIAKWFEQLGVDTIATGKGSRLVKNNKPLPKNLNLNFIENPDVAQTFAVVCVMKQIPFHFTGLETLKMNWPNLAPELPSLLMEN